jgi:regulator of replication initiation timing
MLDNLLEQFQSLRAEFDSLRSRLDSADANEKRSISQRMTEIAAEVDRLLREEKDSIRFLSRAKQVRETGDSGSEFPS